MAFKRPVRSRPIRVFLISMFAVPLVSLLALYGFAASITVSNAISDHEYNVSAAAIASGVEGLTIGLPQERVQTYLWLISGGTAPKTSLLAARKLVDQGIPQVRTALNAQQGLLSAQSRSDLNTARKRWPMPCKRPPISARHSKSSDTACRHRAMTAGWCLPYDVIRVKCSFLISTIRLARP